ncbi:MAG: hypothetical protein AAF724_16425, partial [Pseudomonadota bacterium]
MLFDPQSPVFQAAVAPFLLSFILVGAVTLFAGSELRISLSACGVAIAILVAYWLAFSWPPFPPRASSHKVGYLIAISTVLSVILAVRPWPKLLTTIIMYLALIAGVLWIARSK